VKAIWIGNHLIDFLSLSQLPLSTYFGIVWSSRYRYPGTISSSWTQLLLCGGRCTESFSPSWKLRIINRIARNGTAHSLAPPRWNLRCGCILRQRRAMLVNFLDAAVDNVRSLGGELRRCQHSNADVQQ